MVVIETERVAAVEEAEEAALGEADVEVHKMGEQEDEVTL